MTRQARAPGRDEQQDITPVMLSPLHSSCNGVQFLNIASGLSLFLPNLVSGRIVLGIDWQRPQPWDCGRSNPVRPHLLQSDWRQRSPNFIVLRERQLAVAGRGRKLF